MTKVFVIGYPGEMGGANTECWHTIKLWRKMGIEVHLVPTWNYDPVWKEKLDSLGCVTHVSRPEKLGEIPDLAGGITVGFCNSEYIMLGPILRELKCKMVWVNCMTFMFDYERRFFEDFGPADAMVYQSEFQRNEIEPQLEKCGYTPTTGHLIRGAFDYDDWEYQPQPHESGKPFVLGRAARPDEDKWSSNTWKIYGAVQYEDKKALMLGVSDRTLAKLGPAPQWASCLRPMAIHTKTYYSCLHCLLPVNGGARENWPRAGLEAFAVGVPVVAQGAWGWQEMIEHGVTGFLGQSDYELAHYAAMLAYDENLRMTLIENARKRLINEHANPEKIGNAWKTLFEKFQPNNLKKSA